VNFDDVKEELHQVT